MSLKESLSGIRLKKLESCKDSFEELLIAAVDEVFLSLGDSCRQAIYFRLMDSYDIDKQEIPYRIGDFVNAVEQIFGPGAKVIEIRIMQALYGMVQGFRCFPERDELSLKDYIESLRYSLLR